MKKIDFMSGKEYHKDNEDIKLIIISPKGEIALASKKYDNSFMKKDFNLNYYSEQDKCTYHKDYIQVLLNRFFINNPNYKQFIKKFSPEENLTITNQVIHRLLEDGYIIFSNITSYDGIYFQLHGTNGRLFINYPTITSKQGEALKNIEEDLEDFKEITIENYLDHKKNKCNIITLQNNNIYDVLFEKKSRTK